MRLFNLFNDQQNYLLHDTADRTIR